MNVARLRWEDPDNEWRVVAEIMDQLKGQAFPLANAIGRTGPSNFKMKSRGLLNRSRFTIFQF